ncbi:MAG TPA: DUF2127 domain-containing protein [Candidatus Acidoferrales bacterium]|nr:DUF2127 domain-containing protein [Candidatus Acidoferrales bacterium]
MYCNSCGTQMPDDSRFCPKCGVAVLGAAPAGTPAGIIRSRLARHLPVLAILWMIYAALRLVGGAGAVFVGSTFLPHIFGMGFGFPHFFIPRLVTGIGMILLVYGAVSFAAAWGLWQREPWARVVILVLGIIALINIPFGTALGIYTLWVLMPQEAALDYSRP